jgi:hypothetical protein
MDALLLCLFLQRAKTRRGCFVKDNVSAVKQASTKTKQAMLLLGFIAFTAGILWSVQASEHGAQMIIAQEDTPVEGAENGSEESTSPWSAFLPKSAAQKRDGVRTQRQNELAQMISNFSGVKNATVVLSDDQKQGIGQPSRAMTACVMVEPSNETLSSVTLLAIRTVVADATSGLAANNVNIINTTIGAIATGASPSVLQKQQAGIVRNEVEQSLGLTMATVSVRMHRDNLLTEFIPWIDDAVPVVRVTLPQSWVTKRTGQVGSEDLALQAIINRVIDVAPMAEVTIAVVQDAAIVAPVFASQESYGKQITLLFGILIVIGAGVLPDRRRRLAESVVLKREKSAREEAIAILALNHQQARQAINSLEGAYKIEVLRLIVDSTETPLEEMPVVEIATGTQLELTKCG